MPDLNEQDFESFVPLPTGLADPGENGIVVRTAPYTTAVATDYDIISALGYPPENASARGVPDGFASLDDTGNVPLSQLANVPEVSESDVTSALGFTPENVLLRGAPSGYASLDAAGNVPLVELGNVPELTFAALIAALGFTPEDAASRGEPDGFASLDSTGNVPLAQLGNVPEPIPLTFAAVIAALGFTPENVSNKGASNGYASLDSTANVPLAQLGNVPARLEDPGANGIIVRTALNTTTVASDLDIIDALGWWPINSDRLGVSGGVATLDASANVPLSQLGNVPAAPVTSVAGRTGAVVLDIADIENLGDDLGNIQIDIANLQYDIGQIPPAPVASVFGRTGVVIAASGDYAVSQVTGAAPLASPALTGTPTATTASSGDNSTRIATTAYVDAAVGAGGPGGGLPDPGAEGIVYREDNGTTSIAGEVEITQALGYQPADAAYIGQPNGIATLDSNGQVPLSELGNAPSGGGLGTWSTIMRQVTGADANLLTVPTPPRGIYDVRFVAVAGPTHSGSPNIGFSAAWTDSSGNVQAPSNFNSMSPGMAGTQLGTTVGPGGNRFGSAVIDTDGLADIVVKFTCAAGQGFSFVVSAVVTRIG